MALDLLCQEMNEACQESSLSQCSQCTKDSLSLWEGCDSMERSRERIFERPRAQFALVPFRWTRSTSWRGATTPSSLNTVKFQNDWNNLVRTGRYLVRYPRVVNWYKYQNESEKVAVCTDSDWAGCTRTRRPTPGGCIHRGQHRLEFKSKTQVVVALSSAEAELGAAVKASQEVLGMMSLWKELGATTWDGRRKCSNWDHPTHGTRKGETVEHELVVGSREGSVT